MSVSIRNNAELTRFPFEEKLSITSEEGNPLANNLFVDAKFNSRKPVWLSKITQSSVFFIFEFSTVDGVFETITVPQANHSPPEVFRYDMAPVNSYVKLYDLSSLSTVFGTINFTSDTARFVASRVYSEKDSIVTSIAEKEDGQQLTGAIKFYSGYNIDISLDTDDNSITFSANKGGGLGVFCGTECEEPSECPECIKSINGVTPDEFGRFSIVNGNYSSVTNLPDESTVQLGTLIPPGRIDCTRPGEPAPQGPTGPQGPPGDKGPLPSKSQIPDEEDYQDCVVCDTCETCDTCEAGDV